METRRLSRNAFNELVKHLQKIVFLELMDAGTSMKVKLRKVEVFLHKPGFSLKLLHYLFSEDITASENCQNVELNKDDSKLQAENNENMVDIITT